MSRCALIALIMHKKQKCKRFHLALLQILAKKMIAIMELSQQQLSKQDHYDYGLRSFVIPIARAAGFLKRVDPDAQEEVIL